MYPPFSPLRSWEISILRFHPNRFYLPSSLFTSFHSILLLTTTQFLGMAMWNKEISILRFLHIINCGNVIRIFLMTTPVVLAIFFSSKKMPYVEIFFDFRLFFIFSLNSLSNILWKMWEKYIYELIILQFCKRD